MLLQTAADLLREYPALLVAVTVAMYALRAWQATLSWPEYRAVHRLKRGVFPVLDQTPLGNKILLVSNKDGREDPEYLTTIADDYRGVVGALRAGGGSLHLLNSLKRRPDTHGDPLTVAHAVWTHTDGTQTEAFLWANADGSTDVGAHHEPSTDRPLAHLSGSQANGDVRGVVWDALAAAYDVETEPA